MSEIAGDVSDGSGEVYSICDVLNAYGHDYGDNSCYNVARMLDMSGAFSPNFISCIAEVINFQEEIATIKDLSEELLSVEIPQDRASLIMEEKFASFASIHNFLVKSTQQLFFKRGGERWEAKIPSWIIKNEDELKPIFADLDACKEIKPQKQEYDCIAVLGATTKEMQTRLGFAYDLIKSGLKVSSGLYLLTGERYALPRIDGQIEIELASSHFGIDKSNVTEAHLMEKIHLDYLGKNPDFNVPYKVVDTPRGDKSRPNTIDTVEKFVREHQGECHSTVFVSRNPNTYSQQEGIASVMVNNTMDYEVVGGSCNFSEAASFRDAAYHVIMPMASALYYGWERVEYQFGKHPADEMRNILKFSPQCVVNSNNITLVVPAVT